MTCNNHINQVDYAKEPAPTYQEEKQEYDDADYVLFGKHNA